MCLVAGIYTTVWTAMPITRQEVTYLSLKEETTTFVVEIFINFGKWFMTLMNFVSISLLTSTEMVKFVQGKFMESDFLMIDEEK